MEVFVTAVRDDGIEVGDECFHFEYILANEGNNLIVAANNRDVRLRDVGVEAGNDAKGAHNVLPGVDNVAPKDGYIVSKGDKVD